ncbi:MAG: tetratricopeptide repeat protein [Bacteroidales bacterium]|nr:tetratricopeptide repeat protein [Bacteroidales bacterium]
MMALLPIWTGRLKKAEKLISLHSITVKPEIKKNKALTPKQREFHSKKEYNKWVDDNYLMMGKAYFYKHDFEKAKEIFLFILNEYKNQRTLNETKIWLIKLYNETRKFESAEELIKLLEAEPKLNNKLTTELYAVTADFHIKQNNFEAAIPYLEKAQKHVTKKYLRTRYTFILAQLYEKTGDLKKASESYGKVIKMNPPYEMTFHAKINRALAYEKGFGSVNEIESQLFKMLKDDKNKDYQDQIYYALGNIAMKEGKKDLALDRHKKSVEKNTTNTQQKIVSYLTIADMYYEKPDYVNAQAYYDSSVTLMDSEYPNYDIIYAKSKKPNRPCKRIKYVSIGRQRAKTCGFTQMTSCWLLSTKLLPM